MVVLSGPAVPPIVDVVILVEDTALCGFNIAELKTAYILPALENLNCGPATDLDFSTSMKNTSSFSPQTAFPVLQPK